MLFEVKNDECEAASTCDRRYYVADAVLDVIVERKGPYGGDRLGATCLIGELGDY